MLASSRFCFLALLIAEDFDRSGRDRDFFFVGDVFDDARWEVHSAFADARDFLPVMNAFGPRPLPAAMSPIERPDATDVSFSRILFFLPSRAAASRCLINNQLLRLSPSRLRILVRIQPPLSFSPSRVKSSFPFR